MAVRTTPLSMSRLSKNSSSVPSHTDPPRGTMASPNTVMTIEPVREGSRLSWSTMRRSGGGMRQRIPRFVRTRQRRLPLPLPVLHPQAGRGKQTAALTVRIGIDQAAPAAPIERRPFALALRQAIGDRVDDGGMMAHATMAAFDLDAFGH